MRRFWIFTLMVFISFIAGPFPVQAQDDTSVSLNIFDSLGLNIPVFSITPPSIDVGEDLVFAADPLTYTNNSIASGIDCLIDLTTPNASTVQLSGVTDAAGLCSYDTAQSLQSQNLTLVSGTLADINTNPGNGSGSISYDYQGIMYDTSVDNYTVIDPLTISTPVITITPPQIYPGEDIVVTSTPIEFSNLTVAVNIPCELLINPPQNGQPIVITGTTDVNGVFVFDSSADLNSQGLTLVSGTLSDISNNIGQAQATLTCTYNQIDYPSDPTPYEVIPFPQLVIPDFTITPDLITEDEDLTFVTDPLNFDDNSVATGIPCTLFITTPSTNVVELSAVTDNAGVCRYDTSDTLQNQGWTLLSGNINDIIQVGTGSAYIEYEYLQNQFQTNVDTYEVFVPLTLNPPVINITPPSINPGGSVTVTSTPITTSDGNPAIGITCSLEIVAPGNNQAVVVITGPTDGNGVFTFDSGTDLASQGLTLVSGNLNDISALAGTGTGILTCTYNQIDYPSDPDTYQVVPLPPDLVVPTFTITPDTIFPDEDLTFTTDPLVFDDQSTATGIPCVLYITTPNSQTVTLSKTTDSSGVCEYDTSDTPTNQGWTVVTGNPADIKTVGNGSGYIEYTYNQSTYTTNTDTYTVNPPLTLGTPDITITPPQVYPGEDIVVTSTPIRTSDNNIAINVPCSLLINPPGGAGSVTITGFTDQNGIFVFDSSQDLNSQDLTLVGGSLSDITGAIGNADAVLTCTYNQIDYPSSPAPYEVIPLPPDLVVPNFTINPEEILPTEDLTFTTDPLVFDNTDTATGIPCRLYITTPSQAQVVLSKTTDSSGLCTYTTADTPANQGWIVESGDINLIKEFGTGSGYIEYTYLQSTYQTNVDTYRVYSDNPVVESISFNIDPNSIIVGNPILFELEPVEYNDTTIAEGLVCRLNLIAPDNTDVIFAGLTDAQGRCFYQAPDRATGFWGFGGIQAEAQVAPTLGDPDLLNTVIGSGSGFAEVEDGGNTLVSNVETYDVGEISDEEANPDAPLIDRITDFLVDTPRTGGPLAVLVGVLGLTALVSTYITYRDLTKDD